MLTTGRRYYIDWIRVIAIGLLLIYHVAIGFQPWGIMIGFITSDKPWESLWIPMAMLNIWRIPLLFFVSGMGVYFAMQNRNWKQLLAERAGRILLPFVFGTLVIVPIHTYLWRYYYHMSTIYQPDPGHLWFLGNLFVYVVILCPVFFYLHKNKEGKLVKGLQKILRTPLGVLPVVAVSIVEALLIRPYPYERYAMTWHGFFLGLLAFFFGFCFMLSGRTFGEMIRQWKWLFLAFAVFLFVLRLVVFKMNAPVYLLVTESDSWILSIFAFGYTYLNRPGKALTYLSEAAYPVYILHMVFLYLGALLIFPLPIAIPLQFILILLFTGAGCFAFYELIVRRINFIRPLFGLKRK